VGPDKKVQAICLGIAAVSLVVLSQIGYESLTLVPMIGLGIAWASMIGLPSMMVSTIVPKKQTGIYLGVLNMMIVIPMLAETLTFGWIFKNLLGGSDRTAILPSGILLGCAGLSITASETTIAAAQTLARKRPREVTKRGSPQKWRDRLGGATKGRRYRSFHGDPAASGLLSRPDGLSEPATDGTVRRRLGHARSRHRAPRPVPRPAAAPAQQRVALAAEPASDRRIGGTSA
jgi:hypothetical protein